MKQFAGLGKHEDERGVILDCLPEGTHIHSVLYITGKKGAIRANHWHKKDTHYCYVVDGILRYSHKTDKGEVKSVVLGVGSCVYTPTKEVHKFEFLEDGAFIAMATEPRSEESYEADTIREEI